MQHLFSRMSTMEILSVWTKLPPRARHYISQLHLRISSSMTPKSVISLDVPLKISETTIGEVEVEVNKEAVKEAQEEVKNQCGTQLSLF